MFVQSTTALPQPFDPSALAMAWTDWAQAADGDWPAPVQAFVRGAKSDANLSRLLNAIFGNSPYLTTCALRHPDLVHQIWTRGLDATWDHLMTGLGPDAVPSQPDNHGALMALLRQTKTKAALLIALADISGAWPLARVTAALSDLADGAVKAAVQALLRDAATRGDLKLPDTNTPEIGSGYVVFALGKHGGRELNYSSDIDLIVLFDDEAMPYVGKKSAQEFAVRLTRDLVRMIQERTPDGYVFRTDLRLRPDPGSTAIAVSKSAASIYYESYGQNWERAAMIKARAIAGDMDLARGFLKDLESFIWRRSLDFYTLQDIHSIKRQIYAHKGGGKVAVPGHNIKLGRGGIREIEFFAQTQQLIWGGRKPEARSNQTIAALHVLTDIGVVAPHVRDDLARCYNFLRTLEHRLQMISDEQTQKLPSDDQGLAHVAAFMGFEDTNAFAEHVTGVLRTVETHYAALFEDSPALGIEGNLVFTGTEDDPDTLETLRKLGFQSPSMVSGAVRIWHTGRAKATKSLRARQILTELMPRLLQAFGKTSEPDAAFMRFDHCMNQINTGVQLLSVFYSNPNLLSFIADVMGDAPRLAEDVTANPALLDFVLEPNFFAPPATLEQMEAEVSALAAQSQHPDLAIEAVRRWVNEHRFQVAAQVLNGTLDPTTASVTITAIAEVCLRALLPKLHDDFARSYGRVADSELAIIAYGKLGSRELTPTSDLDIVVVYSGTEDTYSSGGDKSLPASAYYMRLTQRLISALTSLSSQGRLFDVDLRLRPNGDKGPLACSVDAFQQYQLNDAWTWEHMALTRARVVLGSAALRTRLHGIIQVALRKPRATDATVVAIANMRGKMRQAHHSAGVWNVKRTLGGMIDIEFIVQYLLLCHPGTTDTEQPGIADAITRLIAAGDLPAAKGRVLGDAFRLWSQIMTMLRLMVPEADAKPPFPAGLARKLAAATQMPDITALERHMTDVAAQVAAIYDHIIDRPATAARMTFGDNQPH